MYVTAGWQQRKIEERWTEDYDAIYGGYVGVD